MKRGKKIELKQVLDLIKSGYSPSKITKEFKIPKGTLAYHVDKLKKQGCIERKGYGVWKYIRQIKEVRNRPKGSTKGQKSNFLDKKEIRGHAFIWKIEFTEPYEWNKILKSYKKKKLNFSLICNGKLPRTIFNNRKIWLTKKGLTIYEPLDFMGKSSFEVKGRAVFEMDLLIKNLLKELNLKFRQYRFTTSREHYGMIKNELARQYNDKKDKMHIRSEDGDIWLWIDDSKGLGELETQEPNVSRQVQSYWNNHKKHKFKVDADFILKKQKKTDKKLRGHDKVIGHAIETLGQYDKQIALHLNVEQRKLILTQKQEKHLKNQTQLFTEIRDYLKGGTVNK